MGSELKFRRIDKEYLFQLLEARHDSKTPEDFKRIISCTESKMEPEDVKLVLQEFEEWKKRLTIVPL